MLEFLKNTSGNVAVTTAVIAVPLLLSIGAAVDFTNYAQRNSELQNAVDAAILAVGQDAKVKTDAQLKQIAQNYLKSNLSEAHYNSIETVELERLEEGKRMRLTANAALPTNFMQMAGISKLDYSPHAAIQLLGDDFEIALVLDSTFSMSADGKMAALKDAASDFVEELTYFNTLQDRVKIGIVPFAQYVNVGTANRNASWMDVPADSTENICSMQTPVVSQSGCTTTTFYNDGVPQQGQTCSNVVYGDPVEVCSMVETKWYGCAGSRVNPLNIEDRSYGTRVPGIMNVSCGSALTPLTTNKTTLLNAIDALTPQGDTYIATGLTWGLRTLSSHAPFTGGDAYSVNSDTTKVAVLMSDGENVRSISSSDPSRHDGVDKAEADTVTLDICEEIRSKEIVIYTIGFGSSISPDVEALLKDCSTDGINYYPARDSQALADAFQSIAAKITALYLSE